MNSMQVVFLFDLNTCSDFLSISKEEISKKLLSIRLTCIRLLTVFHSNTPNLKWGCKFFDSNGSITQTMCKFAFSDVSLDSFETLENEICVRYERHKSLLQALDASQKTKSLADKRFQNETDSSSPVKILHYALTQTLCEFQWESMDMWSPSAKKFKDNSLFLGKRNFLFLFSDFKDSDTTLFNYFGLNSVPSKQKLTNSLLPPALKESLFKKADIYLIFLNTNADFEFNSPPSSCMLPLLSETLHSVQGCMIPLSILSLPLYNMQFTNNAEKSLNRSEALSDLPCSFYSSLLPFSSLFCMSLRHNFFLKDNNVLSNDCIIVNKGVQISIKTIKIDFINQSLKVQKKRSCFKEVLWSKFVIRSTVPARVCSPACEMLLCLPNRDKSEDSFFQLNKNLTLEGMTLLVECVTNCGVSVPGLFIPLSTKTAIISLLQPANNNILFKPDTKCLEDDALKIQNSIAASIAYKTQGATSQLKSSSIDVNGAEISEDLKPFKMECLETWFKSATSSNFAMYMQSKSKTNSKVKPFLKMLQEAARNSRNISLKSSKKNLTSKGETTAECAEIEGEELPDNLSSSVSQNVDEAELLSDLSYEELVPCVQKMYDSALEQSTNTVSSVKKIVKLVINHYKKGNSENLEENVQGFFESNIITTAKRISEKYGMLDSEEDTKKKIKECQIQVLIILEIENFKMCPHKTECVNSVTSFLRMMIFNCGLADLRNFIQDVLLTNYGNRLNDILVEIGDELNISIFDEDDSAQSPADTISSEIMNEEELFSCALFSNISEKSTSSTNSRKDNSGMEKKLLRRRSDISVTAACRQVILPRTSSKNKKKKAAVNKSIRCSPRIASRKKEADHKPVTDKPRTVRRNLFPGVCQTPKKNKNKQPTTPKRSASKTKFVAETPSHKQNHSALQRRKSAVDISTNSPKVIAESPQIMRNNKDGASKELLEKLQKARLNLMKKQAESLSQPSSCPSFTPETKRRLSLKLFSKFLSSPTARMGVKKCTKRLFDQISPAKGDESYHKKFKVSSVREQASHSTAEQK